MKKSVDFLLCTFKFKIIRKGNKSDNQKVKETQTKNEYHLKARVKRENNLDGSKSKNGNFDHVAISFPNK